MLIFYEEKQVLQNNYVEKIKSKVANLKGLIQSGNAEKLEDHINDIEMMCERVKWLENEFQKDLDNCKAKVEKNEISSIKR